MDYYGIVFKAFRILLIYTINTKTVADLNYCPVGQQIGCCLKLLNQVECFDIQQTYCCLIH